MKNKRPQNTNDEVKRIIKWLKRRKATYEWRGDGVFEVYKSLISLIDDETTWLLMEHNIARLDCEPDVLRWAYLVSDVVLNLFLFNAEYMIADKIEYTVNDIIDMHIRFISGSYRFNYIDNGGIIVKDVVDEWEELIKKL